MCDKELCLTQPIVTAIQDHSGLVNKVRFYIPKYKNA